MDPEVTKAHDELELARQAEHDASARLDQARKDRETAEARLSNAIRTAGGQETAGNPQRKGHRR